jgi:hypothetical protein
MHPTCILWTNQYWLDYYYINNIHTSKLLSNYHVKNLFSIEPKVKCFQTPTLKQMKNVCILVNLLILKPTSSHMHLMHQTFTTLHKLATCSSHLVTTRKTWFPHCWVLMTLANMLQMFKFVPLELCVVLGTSIWCLLYVPK